ncbi:zinc finger protein GAI-ASSOCIATED FACTOR 1-like [Abrus precatorius]|uniref:Zinc finger protein GAI-ASSOCIATED FACTOR 1-like n=1 Tax=Abrus precatorius TaxID=3816 RepID=A0A8B8M697_ABRPR|nr:zinc finger protein GAI-ASSOCIATED FACTOR 1-like [Abrus precatorius]
MSNISGDEGSFSSANTDEEVHQENEQQQQQNHPHGSSVGVCNSNSSTSLQQQQATKKKRNLPGTPDPNAEVIALSPTTLMATNRFVCEICNKGFQRDQNLQLHRRGHNLPWKLRQRASSEVKKRVYVCPEPSCVHHNPARALGDLTGIKKHYSRKHGEKKWKCDKCSKKYAVQSDWKAHQKTCGTREYKCDCGTIFSRRDSFITHRAFCDALTEENNRVSQGLTSGMTPNMQNELPDLMATMPPSTSTNTASEFNNNYDPKNTLKPLSQELIPMPFKPMSMGGGMFSTTSGTLFGGPKNMPPSSSSLQLSSNNSPAFNYFQDSKDGTASAHMSATALLQKAAQMGATASNSINSPMMQKSFVCSMTGPDHVSSPRPLYSAAMHHNNSSYDHFHTQPDQSHMAGVCGGGAFTNQNFHKGQQDMSLIFDSNTTMNDMGMFSTMFIGSEHNPGLMKNVEQEVGSGSTSLIHRRNVAEGNQTGASRFGGSDTTTVHDFLGIGGSTSRAVSLHEPQKQQQQRLELEALTHQRMQIMNHFHHHLPHGDSAMEKSIWDI